MVIPWWRRQFHVTLLVYNCILAHYNHFETINDSITRTCYSIYDRNVDDVFIIVDVMFYYVRYCPFLNCVWFCIKEQQQSLCVWISNPPATSSCINNMGSRCTEMFRAIFPRQKLDKAEEKTSTTKKRMMSKWYISHRDWSCIVFNCLSLQTSIAK